MKIIVALDFSDISDKVLNSSKTLAKAMNAEVTLIHVAEPHPDHIAYDYDPAAITAIDPSEIRNNIAQRFHQEHQSIQQYSDDFRKDGIACKALMIQGPTVELLLAEANKLQADFIVAGCHGKGFISQLLLGSISEDLIKKSTIPIYLIPPDKTS